jgi:hypothetical protein
MLDAERLREEDCTLGETSSDTKKTITVVSEKIGPQNLRGAKFKSIRINSSIGGPKLKIF